MVESKLVLRTHELMLKNNKRDVAIDATLGNGYDSLFLCDHYKRVIGLDIQELAIKRSREKLKDKENVSIYLDDLSGKWGKKNY